MLTAGCEILGGLFRGALVDAVSEVGVALNIVIITEAAGGPLTLATTALVSAIAEGLISNGAKVLVVGTAASTAMWIPETLGTCDSSAPWLSPPTARLADGLAAAKAGVFAPTRSGCSLPSADDWYQELLLDREIRAFAGTGSDGALIVYPRSYAVHRAAVRVADRLGWRVLAVSTEALTDNQIDPGSRDDYVSCIVDCEDGVWALSAHLADSWREAGVHSDRITVDPTIVREALFEASPGTGDPDSAVYIGNLAHREIEYLLDISALVRRQVPDFRLTIYGDAVPERRAELATAVRERLLDGVVRVEASVPPARVPDLLAQARIALLPRSRGLFSEAGFPNKLGEYLAAGRPVVVTCVGDIPRYLTDGLDAVLVPPDDVIAFAEAVVRVLTDDALADAIGERGRETALRFRSDAVASRILAFIDALPRKAAEATSGRLLGVCQGLLRLPFMYVPMVKRKVVSVLRALHLRAPDPGAR